MADPELTNLTLVKASELLKQGFLSPVELVQAYLDRIEIYEPDLNCFITLAPEAALEAARVAEQEIQNGQYRGVLHGIPVGLKDLFTTHDMPTTAGAIFWRERQTEEDAFLVERLRTAGAIILGKLNMHEIALGVTNINPHYGVCRNPWNPEHISGGSSGGSAAALSAHLCLAALGSDTGGSIRIPASLCGIVGLKPTYTRLSLRGVTPLSWNLDHAGPMGRTVADVAHLLQVLAVYDPFDPYMVDQPVSDYLDQLEAGVSGWKIGLLEGAFIRSATRDHIWEQIETAAGVFSALGANVQPLELPEMRAAARANGLMTTSDAAAFHQERLTSTPEGFGSDVLYRLEQGAANSSGDYALARHLQSRLRYSYAQLFQEYDLFLLPTTALTAPTISGLESAAEAPTLTRFTAPFNLTGLPAISLPCGLAQDGLPVGVQLVSSHWGEAALLRAAWAYENAVGGPFRAPVLENTLA